MTAVAQTAADVVILRHQDKVGIDRVFEAWSNPEALAQWFGPHSHNSKIEKYEFKTGGQYQIRMVPRSEEHTSELQSRGLHSYAVFCLKKKKFSSRGRRGWIGRCAQM